MKQTAPTSPFWIYKSSRTLFNPSIIHRYTAFVLTAGLVTLVYGPWAVASGAASYARAQALFAHPLFHAFLVVLAWSFSYHFLAGMRHLILNAGYGLERRTARISGIAVIIATTILTAAGCLLVLFRH